MDIGVVIKKYRKEAGMAQQLLVVGKFAPYCFFSQILRMPWKKSKQDFIISGSNVVNLSPKALIFQGYRALFFLKNFCFFF